MDTPRPIAGPFAQEGSVVALAVSPNGKRLATIAPDDQTTIWDTTSGKETGRLPVQPVFSFVGNEMRRRLRDSAEWSHFAAFVDNDCLLSWGNDPPQQAMGKAMPRFIGACLWNTTSERSLARFDADNCFTLSPDRRSLAAHVGRTVVLWELAARRERATLDIGPTNLFALGFCDDGSTIAVAFPEWSVHCFDAATGRSLRRFDVKLVGPIPKPRNSLLFSPDGEHVIPAGSWDGTLRRWDTRTGREATPLVLHPRLIHNVIYSPDGSRLAAVGKDTAGQGEVVLVVESATGKAIHRIPRPATVAGITTLAFGPNGKTLATGAVDGQTFLWAVP